MIKAILIVEIEHDDFDDIENRGMTIPTIDLYSKKSGERLKAYSDLELKPLPEYKEEKMPNYVNDYEYEHGWNACLDEILWLGEE